MKEELDTKLQSSSGEATKEIIIDGYKYLQIGTKLILIIDENLCHVKTNEMH